MDSDGKRRGRSGIIDAIVGAGVSVFLLVCLGALMACYPALWERCLTILDVRNWPHWAWTAVGVALLAVFLLIRIWPENHVALLPSSARDASLEQSSDQ